ncbi:hypothetical protein EVAR_84488_1 [Eumeta japonica]|uniref:Uncharacterized protein n=1 Tax=Eumeta variegata TaxID=151549 RepID=A0A4C1UHK1_EUMVA|nr:hypothetical protein EVAR_84488_1 [Eumeta japonica]
MTHPDSSFRLKVARIPAGSTLPSLLIQTRTCTPPPYAPFGVSSRLVSFSHCDRLKVERMVIIMMMIKRILTFELIVGYRRDWQKLKIDADPIFGHIKTRSRVLRSPRSIVRHAGPGTSRRPSIRGLLDTFKNSFDTTQFGPWILTFADVHSKSGTGVTYSILQFRPDACLLYAGPGVRKPANKSLRMLYPLRSYRPSLLRHDNASAHSALITRNILDST